MKRVVAIGLGALVASIAAAQLAPSGDPAKPVVGKAAPPVPNEKTSASGIREALAIGTENAVRSLSRVDGYLGNQAVRIALPPNIRKLADVARKAGLQQPVDDFVLRMNRAAEAAAPLAARHFGDAIRTMSLEDARGILLGGDTAATDFFRRKTRERLYAEFKPIVSQKVGEAGATRAYKDLIARFESMPMIGLQPLDLDDYVSNKALDGLYHMVAQEEKKIRSNPLARTTDLLRAVFGR